MGIPVRGRTGIWKGRQDGVGEVDGRGEIAEMDVTVTLGVMKGRLVVAAELMLLVLYFCFHDAEQTVLELLCPQ